jgi:hypothetical protein
MQIVSTQLLAAAKLKYVVQHFMLFPMIYTKLGHKLVNVKTARINK